jgi:DNA-binding LytR/AlgR family response regulator
MIKYLIVDDDDIDRMAIEAQAGKFPFFHKIAACSNPVEAMELIHLFQPDVLFVDIEMPGMTGLDLIRCLSGKIPAPVFITSHPDFALEGYEMEAFDYILKPLDPERFARCAARLHDFFELRAKAFAFEKDQAGDCIVIKQGYDKFKIVIHDILYLEAMKDYTRIVTSSKPYLVLGTLTGMCDKLPQGKFVRIHRSYIVNRSKIRSVHAGKVQLDGCHLPVGKVYRNAVGTLLN